MQTLPMEKSKEFICNKICKQAIVPAAIVAIVVIALIYTYKHCSISNCSEQGTLSSPPKKGYPAELQSVQCAFQQTQQQLGQIIRALEIIQTTLHEKDTAVQELTRQLIIANKAITDERQENRALAERLQEVTPNARVIGLTKQITDLIAERAVLDAQVKGYMQENSRLGKRLSELQQRYQLLDREYAGISALNTALKERMPIAAPTSVRPK
jgi:chromosome segregation ATPase